MSEKKYYVQVPKGALEQANLAEEEQLELRESNQRLIFSKAKGATVEKIQVTFVWQVLPTLLATALFFGLLFFNHVDQLAFTGKNSLAGAATWLGLITGMFCFISKYLSMRDDKKNQTITHYWRNFPAVVAAFAMILFLALLMFFNVLGLVFQGLSFDKYTSTLIFFAIIILVNYAMLLAAANVTPTMLINLLTIVIVSGVIAAVVKNEDNQLWQYNFSFLGTVEAQQSWRFNVTLIISAALLIAMLDYIFVTLREKYHQKKSLYVLQVMLALIAVNLGAVGLFPYSENSFSGWMHNHVASNLVYLVLILMVGLKWLVPEVSKSFLLTTYVTLAVLVLTMFLFQGVHYLSLTAFELISFLLAFSWLFSLLQHLQQLVVGEKVYLVEVKQIEENE